MCMQAFVSPRGLLYEKVERLAVERGLKKDTKPKSNFLPVNPSPTFGRLRRIQLQTCFEFGIRMEEMLGPCRKAQFVVPRQVAIYLASKMTGFSKNEIGRRFNRDHSTIYNSVLMVDIYLEKEMKTGDRDIHNHINSIQSAIDWMEEPVYFGA